MHCTHIDIYIHNYGGNYLVIFFLLKLRLKVTFPVYIVYYVWNIYIVMLPWVVQHTLCPGIKVLPPEHLLSLVYPLGC